VTYVGYAPHVVDEVLVTASKSTVDLGELRIEQGAVDVGAVNVSSTRPDVSVRADKTVYSVENNSTYTATNVSELLGQIPTIQVDPDGKVSLRGDDNVTIMMNDRPLTMPAEARNKTRVPASTSAPDSTTTAATSTRRSAADCIAAKTAATDRAIA
jgi:hypothetical protein